LQKRQGDVFISLATAAYVGELIDHFCNLIRARVAFQDDRTKRHNTESLLDTGKDGFLEVYVSAVEHPGRFWVQVSWRSILEECGLVDNVRMHLGEVGWCVVDWIGKLGSAFSGRTTDSLLSSAEVLT
jgi:hypothetical protein